jgi:serine kinase of HPr protein (carbohydrate metabolism regulator)
VSETVHATCIAIQGRGVLIAGRSGSGKSDLALRLIDRGARLVSDDYTDLREADGRLLATAPPAIAGKIEMRGVGILEMDALPSAPVCLLVDLDRAPERLPEAAATVDVAGFPLPALGLSALEASAPIKLEQALLRFGLEPA